MLQRQLERRSKHTWMAFESICKCVASSCTLVECTLRVDTVRASGETLCAAGAKIEIGLSVSVLLAGDLLYSCCVCGHGI